MLRVRIVLDVGQSGLPLTWPESIELTDPVELDWEERPSRRSILKDIVTKMGVSSLDDRYKWTLTGMLSKIRRSQLHVPFPVCLRNSPQEFRGSLLAVG